jgi:hypothetical protein
VTFWSKIHLYHAGGINGIELNTMRAQPRGLQGLQQARACCILPYPGYEDRYGAEGAEVPGYIEWRATQHFPVGKPVYQNFAKYEHHVANIAHCLIPGADLSLFNPAQTDFGTDSGGCGTSFEA